ncbi:MAG: response regulator transcription factor [Leptospiraceae bacterium]|nr:response regulator transcription factor [Leptospiraceae bacterium]
MNSLFKNEQITYGIVDDDEVFRSMLASLLRMKKETGKILEFSSAEDILQSDYLKSLDFLIVDYRLKKIDGIALLGDDKIKALKIPKLILSGFDAEKKIFEALKYGATGYMFKEELYSLDSILEILQNGGAFISPTIALRVVTFFKDIKKSEEDFEDLTDREEEILRELSSGYSPKEIAETLKITVSTVRSHIKNIYKKLEVNNQIQLLKKAKEKNLL